MVITVLELRNNLEKYLELLAHEDILNTQNEKVIAKLTTPLDKKVDTAISLFGILPKKVTLEEAKKGRLLNR